MAAFRPEDHPRKLNLGCGFDHKPGYLNVDLRDFHGPDLVADVCELTVLPDGWYEELLAQDLLEHLPRTRTRTALAEWNRVLKVGGVLHVRTTSLLGLLDLFRHPDFRSIGKQEGLVQCLFGTQAYEGDFHLTAFTAPLLEHYLDEAGFRVDATGTIDMWLLDVRATKVRDAKPVDEPIARLVGIADEGEFLRRAYVEILGRVPDADGLAFYREQLRTGAMRREGIVRSLLASEERARRDLGSTSLPSSGDTPDNATYDLQTRQIMERVLRPGSNCVDVGCHAGSFLVQMLELAPAGRHFAFEPLPHLREQLETRFAGDPRVSVFACALSDSEGEVPFQHVVTNPGYSGLRRRRYDGEERIEEIRVRTRRLDDLLYPELAIDFVKIDVEGAELQVLRGAARTLARWRPVVVFEHGLGAADCFGTAPEDVFDLLTESCGLRVSLLSGWLSADEPLTRAAFADQFRRGLHYYFVAHP